MGLDAFRAAVYTKISGSALATAVGNRFYYDHAIEGAAMPYLVWLFPNFGSDWDFSSNYENVVIQVNMFDAGSSAATCAAVQASLHTLLDQSALAVTGYTCYGMNRDWARPPEWLPEERAWMAVTEYSFLAKEN